MIDYCREIFNYVQTVKVDSIFIVTGNLVDYCREIFDYIKTVKVDSIFIVLGNLVIAIIVAKILTSRQKKDEISLDHCIKDISELLSLLKEIKEDIQEIGQKSKKSNIKFLNKPLNTNTKNIDNDIKKREIVSKVSIFQHLIGMLENHALIEKSNIDNIKSIFASFEDDIMGTSTIQEQWFDNHLKLQRHLLIMKSEVSKKFRQ